jgi:hypothetical protein
MALGRGGLGVNRNSFALNCQGRSARRTGRKRWFIYYRENKESGVLLFAAAVTRLCRRVSSSGCKTCGEQVQSTTPPTPCSRVTTQASAGSFLLLFPTVLFFPFQQASPNSLPRSYHHMHTHPLWHSSIICTSTTSSGTKIRFQAPPAADRLSKAAQQLVATASAPIRPSAVLITNRRTIHAS